MSALDIIDEELEDQLPALSTSEFEWSFNFQDNDVQIDSMTAYASQCLGTYGPKNGGLCDYTTRSSHQTGFANGSPSLVEYVMASCPQIHNFDMMYQIPTKVPAPSALTSNLTTVTNTLAVPESHSNDFAMDEQSQSNSWPREDRLWSDEVPTQSDAMCVQHAQIVTDVD